MRLSSYLILLILGIFLTQFAFSQEVGEGQIALYYSSSEDMPTSHGLMRISKGYDADGVERLVVTRSANLHESAAFTVQALFPTGSAMTAHSAKASMNEYYEITRVLFTLPVWSPTFAPSDCPVIVHVLDRVVQRFSRACK
jgi:hypothetical protein